MNVMENLKHVLEENLGKRVIVKADRGRKRIVTKQGVLDSVYPSLFVVSTNDKDARERKLTFTYADLLTSTVKLMILEDEPEMQAI